jgi:hypothetical protein
MTRILFLTVCLGLFAGITAAQADVSDNEIDGLKFSTQEKVKHLSLLVSSKEDVIATFGKDCERGGRFNDDWDISFSYVGAGWSNTRIENGKEVVYNPSPAIVGKLADITFKPRRDVVLPETTFFPPGLRCSDAVTSRGGLEFKSIVCTDHRSLAFFFYGEDDPLGKYKKNQILHITYTTIPTDRIYTQVSP